MYVYSRVERSHSGGSAQSLLTFTYTAITKGHIKSRPLLIVPDRPVALAHDKRSGSNDLGCSVGTQTNWKKGDANKKGSRSDRQIMNGPGELPVASVSYAYLTCGCLCEKKNEV